MRADEEVEVGAAAELDAELDAIAHSTKEALAAKAKAELEARRLLDAQAKEIFDERRAGEAGGNHGGEESG